MGTDAFFFQFLLVLRFKNGYHYISSCLGDCSHDIQNNAERNYYGAFKERI